MPILQPVSFSNTPDPQEADIARRLALANSLQQQAMNPGPEIQKSGNIVVGPSWTSGLARMLSAYQANKVRTQAEAEKTKLATDKEARRQADMSLMVNALRGRPATPGGLTEDASGNVTQTPAQPAMTPVQSLQQAIPMMAPQMQQVALPMMLEQQKFEEERTRHAADRAEKEREFNLRNQELGQARADLIAERQRAEAARTAEAQRAEGVRVTEARNRQQAEAQLRRELAQQQVDLRREIANAKGPTEAQARANMFGTRAALSDAVMQDLEENISTTGLSLKSAAQNVPLIGGVLGVAGNAMLSPEQQKVEQAQRDFVNATLRQESGAVISPQEFDNAKKQYFPQPGDSKEVIAQKRANRQTVIAGFRNMSGPLGPNIDQELALRQGATRVGPQATGKIGDRRSTERSGNTVVVHY